MIAPHWLDGIFAAPNSLELLVKSKQFQESVSLATKEYEQQRSIQEGTMIVGLAPSQAARLKFLELINQP